MPSEVELDRIHHGKLSNHPSDVPSGQVAFYVLASDGDLYQKESGGNATKVADAASGGLSDSGFDNQDGGDRYVLPSSDDSINLRRDGQLIRAEFVSTGPGSENSSSGRFRMPHADWLTGRNAAGDGDVNMWKVNAEDYVQSGVPVDLGQGAVAGQLETESNPGPVAFMDMHVTSQPDAGSEHSYSFTADGQGMLKIYTEADGSGSIQNPKVRALQRFSVPDGTSAKPGIMWNNDDDTGFHRPSPDTIHVVTNGGARHEFQADGDLAIEGELTESTTV